MILNMFSSGAMTRLGYVYGNLMINVNPKNSKLSARAISILQAAARVDKKTAQQALKAAKNSVPVALVMLYADVDRRNAEQALKSAKGHVRQAITAARSL
jgi:N-acetylmuramic acid 6-phosphate etherase